MVKLMNNMLILLIVAALACTAAAQPAADPNSGPASPNGQDPNAVPPPQDPNSTAGRQEPDTEDLRFSAQSPMPKLCKAIDDILTQFADDKGCVNYSLLRRKRSALSVALVQLEQTHPAQIMAMEQDEKIAYWINAYNLCTLKLIVDNYPIQPKWYMLLYPNNSIMQITAPWTKNFFKIQGLEYNLEEIEKELLLERFKDPRICFALCNATRGGAFLRQEAYRGEKLNEQLDDQVCRYLSDPRGIRLDKETKALRLSNLFNMQQKTFVESSYAQIKRFRQRTPQERAWLNFINEFTQKKETDFLEDAGLKIDFIEYDWNLNEFSK